MKNKNHNSFNSQWCFCASAVLSGCAASQTEPNQSTTSSTPFEEAKDSGTPISSDEASSVQAYENDEVLSSEEQAKAEQERRAEIAEKYSIYNQAKEKTIPLFTTMWMKTEKTKQKWETWHTHKEALKRKAEIENQQHTGTFLPPSNQTITEFLYDFVSLYGEKKWGVSMYDSQTALIANYINPIIGDMEVQAVTPRAVDGYIQTLQKTKSVSTKTRKAVTTYVSDKTIEKIIKLLRCAFKQAVRWEIIARNPFDNVILPKTEYAKRDIWTADMIRLALDKCTDSKLYVAMNLSFACSLRMGEILGLTWENVHISDEDIAADNAYVYVDKELTRASKRAIETLGEKDIRFADKSIPSCKLMGFC